MQPPDGTIWHRVPGYDSGDDESEGTEDAALAPVVRDRLGQISAALGQREEVHSAAGAEGAGAPPCWEFMPAPMPSSMVSKDPKEPKEAFVAPPNVPRYLQPYSQEPGFRIEHTDAPVVRDTLLSNGLRPSSDNWLILWSGPRMHESTYEDLCEHQRVNHFPGSTELTRKDRLWCHFNDMAQICGRGAFDFVPETFVLPDQLEAFIDAYEKTDSLWIVKPTASSRGRGIFLLRSLDELPVDELSVVSRYIHNPMLIQGLKFDLRVYVLVTGYEPLRAYIYREGLTRFACLPYSTEDEHLQDAYRHLTNYSINKDSSEFVENKDFEADNVGHKWSLSALNKHLKCIGVDVKLMWVRIMDVLVKTLLSVEPVIAARTRQIASHSTNCFELYGFDVLMDADLKPWLLEVNLSPSMQADSPLDWQIKSSLLRDVLNLVGVPRVDRQTLMRHRLESRMRRGQMAPTAGPHRPPTALGSVRKGAAGFLGSLPRESRPGRAAEALAPAPPVAGGKMQQRLVLDHLTDAELKALSQALQEYKRCHNFIRLYPTRTTVDRYAQIASERAASKQDQARRTTTSRCSQIYASLLFGPSPVRPPPASALSALPEPSAARCGSAPSLLNPLAAPPVLARPETLAPLLNNELPFGAARRVGGGAFEEDAGISPCSTDASSSPNRGILENHGSMRRALEAVKELGMRDGCRVVLMEYLIRIGDACSKVGTAEMSKLPQAAFARLSAFQKRLNRSVKAATVAKLPHGHREREHSGSPHGLPTDGRALVEDLAAACKACLACLQEEAEPEPGKPPTLLPAAGPLPVVLGREDPSNSSLARHLPTTLTQSAVGQRILAIVPRLSALELERLLADPRCDAEFRALLDPSGAEREPMHRRVSPSRTMRRRQASRPSSGRLEPRRVLWGPLSELLQGQAVLDSARPTHEGLVPRPRTQEQRGRSVRGERLEEEASTTSFERLMGSWAKIAQKGDDSWQAALPKTKSPQAPPLGPAEPGPEHAARRRHRSGSAASLAQAMTADTSPQRAPARTRPYLPASTWSRDIEL
mmetsp:Transcript_165650/g.402545  ORF Transcript_165650/g.402545 Transcript_165650/m.402545 type:complete len:1046 (+) Transcript_165650:104-3241(+)